MAGLETGVCKDRDVWNRYVSSHPTATQYHRYEWLAIVEQSFEHRVYPLVAREGDRIRGIFPLIHIKSVLFGNCVVSLPFLTSGGILADDETVRDCLWHAAIALARNWGATSLESREFSAYRQADHTKIHKATMVLELAPSIEAQWTGFDAKLRNQIRKAERSGLIVRVGRMQDLSGFYEVFARNMRDLGTPVYGRRFFEKMFEYFPETSYVFSVCLGNTVIAACIALESETSVEVPSASSLRDYRSLCPNTLMYWAVIQTAIKAGRAQFDFGRSTVGDGTYRFKEQWGAKAVPMYFNYWLKDPKNVPDVTTTNPAYQFAIAAWKRLPVWLSKALGPSIIRNIP
jgi:FemAB-related protein (PEP-CTERM system-associated)